MVATLIDWPPDGEGARRSLLENSPSHQKTFDRDVFTKDHAVKAPLDSMIDRAKIQRAISRRVISQLIIEGKGR